MVVGVVVSRSLVARLVPGDPAVTYAGPRATPGAARAGRGASSGSTSRWPVQLVDYLKGIATGDWGTALHTHRPVLDDLATAMPASLELVDRRRWCWRCSSGCRSGSPRRASTGALPDVAGPARCRCSASRCRSSGSALILQLRVLPAARLAAGGRASTTRTSTTPARSPCYTHMHGRRRADHGQLGGARSSICAPRAAGAGGRRLPGGADRADDAGVAARDTLGEEPRAHGARRSASASARSSAGSALRPALNPVIAGDRAGVRLLAGQHVPGRVDLQLARARQLRRRPRSRRSTRRRSSASRCSSPSSTCVAQPAGRHRARPLVDPRVRGCDDAPSPLRAGHALRGRSARAASSRPAARPLVAAAR